MPQSTQHLVPESHVLLVLFEMPRGEYVIGPDAGSSSLEAAVQDAERVEDLDDRWIRIAYYDRWRESRRAFPRRRRLEQRWIWHRVKGSEERLDVVMELIARRTPESFDQFGGQLALYWCQLWRVTRRVSEPVWVPHAARLSSEKRLTSLGDAGATEGIEYDVRPPF